MTTRGESCNNDIAALLKARNTLLWIVTREELRVERAILDIANGKLGSQPTMVRFWDCATGLSDEGFEVVDANMQDPRAVLREARDKFDRCVYVLRDYHKWLADPFTLRDLRSLARELQAVPGRSLIVLTPSAEVPPELAGCATVIDYPLPDREEIASLLDTVIASLPPEIADKAAPNGVRDAAIDAAVGLSTEEASSCYSRSLVTTRGRIDPALVAGEKKRVIAREKVLTWYDPDPRGLDAVGGLDLLKQWLTQRKLAFSPKAREFGLQAPRGALLVGIAGCGKSLTAKCIASAWGMPLLRLDMGALRSKFVGDSEANVRRALSVAEAVSPCILWADEVEKSLAGASGPQGDGGVAADALGALLSWMQERQGSVFVVATANDVRALPPEFLRKGRFDEVFWVDLPTKAERAAILAAALKQHGRDPKKFDLDALASAANTFTGAEVASLVPDALFAAFAAERELSNADLMNAAQTQAIAPLSKTAGEKIKNLREWGAANARPASSPEGAAPKQKLGRAIDID